jgi:hypothetical protein
LSYNDIVSMRSNSDLVLRLTACAAQEQPGDPDQWVQDHIWDLVAAPGWADKWASALATDPPNPAPGYDMGVITDGDILAAVQAAVQAGG